MMRHEGPHHHARDATREPRGSVVDGLIQAVAAVQSVRGEPLQVPARLLGRHHQRQRRGVGGNDDVLGQAALEPEAGHAKGPVLVIEMSVHGVVAGFRDSPGKPAHSPVLDLPPHGRGVGLVEQRVFVGRHDQQRHEVLEHGAAPGQ